MSDLRPLLRLLGLTLFFALAGQIYAHPGIRIAIAGDSTAATWQAPHPERGWGQFIAGDFDRSVSVENFAKPGASTKTFLEEGLWGNVVASRPDYVLIQFGHNDSHPADHPEHTDPDGLYSALLRRFVNEARAAGSVPVLITPVQRRTRIDTLLPYVAAMKKVAEETHAPLVDLHELSGELYARLGPAAQDELGAQKSDPTHFNATGAKQVADLVASALCAVVPALRPHRVEPK